MWGLVVRAGSCGRAVRPAGLLAWCSGKAQAGSPPAASAPRLVGVACLSPRAQAHATQCESHVPSGGAGAAGPSCGRRGGRGGVVLLLVAASGISAGWRGSKAGRVACGALGEASATALLADCGPRDVAGVVLVPALAGGWGSRRGRGGIAVHGALRRPTWRRRVPIVPAARRRGDDNRGCRAYVFHPARTRRAGGGTGHGRRPRGGGAGAAQSYRSCRSWLLRVPSAAAATT